jgi:hypothetical protein
VKWRKASLAASFWATLEDLQGKEEWNDWPLTETEALKLGSWSGPSFTVEYFDKPHCCLWQSSCSLVLYILSLPLSKLLLMLQKWKGYELFNYFWLAMEERDRQKNASRVQHVLFVDRRFVVCLVTLFAREIYSWESHESWCMQYSNEVWN